MNSLPAILEATVYRREEIERQTKFYEDLKDLKNELTCGICKKMILECASIVPCLHRCIECLLLHFIGSQKCPGCGVRCEDFRKDTFFNNIIEAYEEYGSKRGKYEKEKLERKRIFVRFEFGNGEVYEGEWKKFRTDGRGKFLFKNGDVYEGDWKNNLIEGKGKMTWTDGELYKGNCKNNQREGYGKMKYKEGSVFEGDWVNNLREGKGKIIKRNGEVYEGTWKNDEREDTIQKFFNWVGERLICLTKRE